MSGIPKEVKAWLAEADPEALQTFHGSIDTRLEEIEQEKDDEAKAAIEEILQKRGKTIHELYGWRKPQPKRAKSSGTAAKKPKGPTYKHPVTGATASKPRGNPKAWLKDLLDQGFKLEEFEVQPDGSIGDPDVRTWQVRNGEVTSDP